MAKSNAYRPIPLALTALIAVFSALVALAVSGGHDMTAHAATAHSHSHATNVPAREVALRTDMRRLWEDHVTWTRLAIISLTTGSPDTNATVARLLRNQTDIGNAIKPYYGAAAGKQLTKLLREHILIAADLIAAAKKGDQEATGAEQARWTANADQIAALLNSANPRFWKLGATEGDDARPSAPDDQRGRRAAPAELGRRRSRLRPDRHAGAAHGRHALERHRRPVPEPVPLDGAL